MIFRATLFLVFIFFYNTSFAQCECEEDFNAPNLSLESYLLFSNCIDDIIIPPPIASDDCSPEPIVSSTSDTISDEYCGIAPVFSLSCGYAQPTNLYLGETFANWGPYISESLGFRRFDDGTVRITGTISSAINPDVKMALELNLLPGLDWNAYSALGPGYTYHYGCLDPNVPYSLWQYYRLNTFGSYLIGQNALAGTFLQIQSATDAPGRAFQIGNGANGVVAENGISGAFQYSGSIQYNGQNLGFASEVLAEFIGLISCCPSPYINTTHLAEDLCGNIESYDQIIEIRDHIPPVANNLTAEEDFLFCDQLPNFALEWTDDCSETVNHLFVSPETTWVMGTDQCGNHAIIQTDIELLYPVGESCLYFGCTDENASNYSPSAIFDDGSCNTSTIAVRVFIDANANGIYDPFEDIYPGIWIENIAMEESVLSVGGEDTYVSFNTLSEQTTIAVFDDPNDVLEPTTSLIRSFFSATPPNTIYFGFVQVREPDEVIEISLLPEQPLCPNTLWEVNIQIKNISPSTIAPGIVTIILPNSVELELADNLIAFNDSSITMSYNSIGVGQFTNLKVNLLPNLGALAGAETVSFAASANSSEENTTFDLPVACSTNPSGALEFWATPIGFGSQNFIDPDTISYLGIFSNTTDEVIQQLDLTFLPDTNTSPSSDYNFSASYPFTMDRSNNPLRYNIHFENLNLAPSSSVSFTYDLDCSDVQFATDIEQTIYFSFNNSLAQTSNSINRTIVICNSFELEYSNNIDQCIEELILNTSSNFYTDFYWVNDQNIYTGEQVNIAIDSIASPLFTLVGENSICQRELNFEIGEIHQPRQLSVPIGNTFFCAGDSLTLVPQSNVTALEWYNGAELIAVDDQLIISNTMDITVVAPASGPCPAATQSLSLTRIEPVTAQLQYNGDALLCAGESLIVTASGTNGETILFVNDSPLNELTYEVTGSEEIRVQTTNSCFVAGDTLSTTTGVFPELDFILSGDTAFCQGEAINIDVEGVGDLSLFVNSNPVNTWPINVFTSSTVEATATNVCGTVNDSFNVVVYPNPSSDFVYDQTTQTITAVDPGTYQWLLFGDPIEGATSQSYTITQTGAYALQTTSEFGCTSSSSNEFINYIGVDEKASTNWLLYPNPTQDLLYIRGLEDYIGQELNVVNALGQTVYRQSQILSNTIQIDVRLFAKGIYHLSIGTNSSSFIVE